ncbi:tetratricopeptide repeat protein [Actinoplanes aureus]|uniref:Tetratricopeptide repeat protein n=1 Tax=Actinoplanes aureus TaxID=2792083 RepID=A0A931CG40_9ACTN|nr:tetratricopeptide repeat protein [Actinoplanes aureus]MBG0567347.1 tetratricopeptide repeat protein [Actinoplanes aureus]
MSQPSPLTPALERAHALIAAGDLAGARALLERAAELGRANLGEDDPDVLATLRELAAVYQRADDPAAARRVLEEAYAAGQWRLGDSDPLLLQISYDLGLVAQGLGNRHEARRAFSRVAGHGPAVLGAQHWAVTRAQAYLHQDQNPSSVRETAQSPPAPPTELFPPSGPGRLSSPPVAGRPPPGSSADLPPHFRSGPTHPVPDATGQLHSPAISASHSTSGAEQASPGTASQRPPGPPERSTSGDRTRTPAQPSSEAATHLFPPGSGTSPAGADIGQLRPDRPPGTGSSPGSARPATEPPPQDVMNVPTRVFPTAQNPEGGSGRGGATGPWAAPPERNGPWAAPPAKEPPAFNPWPGEQQLAKPPGPGGQQGSAGPPWPGQQAAVPPSPGGQQAAAPSWPSEQQAAVPSWPSEQQAAVPSWPSEQQAAAPSLPGGEQQAAAPFWPGEQHGAGGLWPGESQQASVQPGEGGTEGDRWPEEEPDERRDAGGVAVWLGAPGVESGRGADLLPGSGMGGAYQKMGESRRRGMALFAVVAAMVAAVLAVAALVFVLADRATEPVPAPTSSPAASSVPTLAGEAPGSVLLDDRGSSVGVGWSDPAGGRAPFVVMMGRPGERLKPVSQVGAGQTSFRMSGLNEGLDYCFAVVVVYATDRFASSEQVCTRRSR